MNREEKLTYAIGQIDEKYIKEAEGGMNMSAIIKVAVVLVVMVALGLYLFLPFAPVTSDLNPYADSSYYPLIQGIEEYRLSFKQPTYNNNFEGIMGTLGSVFEPPKGGMDMAPGDNLMGSADMENSTAGNGSYVENTDNQVEGVIESDLMKMTDKYIFRLAGGTLKVYSIEKENSALISEFEIPTFKGEQGFHSQQMYLSADSEKVTVIKEMYDYSDNSYNVGLISIDVSDLMSIKTRSMVLVEGELNTSRMVDGKLLLVTNYSFNRNSVDYNDPTTFVPSIDSGNGEKPIEFENIIYPEKIDSTRYSVVALLDEENLEVLGANALLNFTSEVYVAENNLYITREYVQENEANDKDYDSYSTRLSDVAIISYEGGKLTEKGVVTIPGWTEDQYSFDEKDGYLRVVTSTLENYFFSDEMTSGVSMNQNVSLYIVDLKNVSIAYKVENFAIEGEEATAVRFEGDKLYVCTAVVISFTDPVYFFDLSDYENIGSADTGVIDGYSDHLINYGEGLALGIGREDWSFGKVEIYEQLGSSVVSAMEYKFQGEYSLNYKSYLVNRENNLFGFGVDYFFEYDQQTQTGSNTQRYVLLEILDSELVVRTFTLPSSARANEIRAAYIDGYLYITSDFDLFVEKIH